MHSHIDSCHVHASLNLQVSYVLLKLIIKFAALDDGVPSVVPLQMILDI